MTEQEKRDQIVKAIECRLDINHSKYKHCLSCNYRHDIDHCQWACQTDGILEDILALLKMQEPRKPHYTTLKYLVNGMEVVVDHPECPKCIENGLVLWDAEIEKGAAFCKRCGQAVKWND